MEFYDVFGNAIADYYYGDKSAKIIVNTNGLDHEVLEIRQLFRTISSLPDLEKQALVFCKGKVLDIGAGAGCHSLILQEMGLDVTALEISPLASDIMKLRGVNKIINRDIFDISNLKFDCLLMLMNGLGIVGSRTKFQEFLKIAREILIPGGCIIGESSDLLYLANQEDCLASISNDSYYGEISYQLEYKGNKGKRFDWLFIDFKNLKKIARNNGFDAGLLFEDNLGGYLFKLTSI